MRSSNILIAAGGFFVEPVLTAIFRPELEQGFIELVSMMTMSSAFGVVEGSALYDPLRPAVMVANTDEDTEEEIEEGRAASRRMLHRASFHANWLVAFAIPDAEAWIMGDPAIREAVDRMYPPPATRRERIERITAITEHTSVDREAIGRAFPDFRALCEFIKAHTRASEPVA